MREVDIVEWFFVGGLEVVAVSEWAQGQEPQSGSLSIMMLMGLPALQLQVLRLRILLVRGTTQAGSVTARCGPGTRGAL